MSAKVGINHVSWVNCNRSDVLPYLIRLKCKHQTKQLAIIVSESWAEMLSTGLVQAGFC